MMTSTIVSTTTARADRASPFIAAPAATGAIAGIADFWRAFLAAAFDPYCPERHYMRGPGPACRARQRMTGQS